MSDITVRDTCEPEEASDRLTKAADRAARSGNWDTAGDCHTGAQMINSLVTELDVQDTSIRELVRQLEHVRGRLYEAEQIVDNLTDTRSRHDTD